MTEALLMQAKAEAPSKVNARQLSIESRLAWAGGLHGIERRPLTAQPPLVQARPLAGQITPLVQRQTDVEEEDEESIQAKGQDGLIQREEASEEEDEKIQAKLVVGPADDEYEREADRVADQVMSMQQPRVQRAVEEEEEELQTKPLAGQITPLVQRQDEPEEEEEIQAKRSDDPVQSTIFKNNIIIRDRIHKHPVSNDLKPLASKLNHGTENNPQIMCKADQTTIGVNLQNIYLKRSGTGTAIKPSYTLGLSEVGFNDPKASNLRSSLKKKNLTKEEKINALLKFKEYIYSKKSKDFIFEFLRTYYYVSKEDSTFKSILESSLKQNFKEGTNDRWYALGLLYYGEEKNWPTPLNRGFLFTKGDLYDRLRELKKEARTSIVLRDFITDVFEHGDKIYALNLLQYGSEEKWPFKVVKNLETKREVQPEVTSEDIGYKKAQADIWPPDISYSDVRQGNIGDCYLLAALAAIAISKPDIIKNMIGKNPNGTYTVLFHNPYNFRVIEKITILPGFPERKGKFVYAGTEEYESKYKTLDGAKALWVQIVEKAYAAWHGEKGGYKSIMGGIPQPETFDVISGKRTFKKYIGKINWKTISPSIAINLSEDQIRSELEISILLKQPTTLSTYCSIKNQYVFSWTKIPGTDDKRLKEFLGKKYHINWVYTARIDKSEDGKTIRISKADTTLSLTLNDKDSEIILKIDNIEKDKFIAKEENGELNIYKNPNRQQQLSWEKINKEMEDLDIVPCHGYALKEVKGRKITLYNPHGAIKIYDINLIRKYFETIHSGD